MYPLTRRGPDSLIQRGQGRRLSSSTMCDAIQGTGFYATTHGMRALINTYLSEVGFRREALEAHEREQRTLLHDLEAVSTILS
jgi:hypothetical protein